MLDGLNKERPLLDTEALHLSQSLILFPQEQPQLAITVQVDVGASGVLRGFDADGEAGCSRGDGIGSKVDNDGPRGIEPLQRSLGATQVHLLHIPGVAFMSQTAGRKVREKTLADIDHPWQELSRFCEKCTITET